MLSSAAAEPGREPRSLHVLALRCPLPWNPLLAEGGTLHACAVTPRGPRGRRAVPSPKPSPGRDTRARLLEISLQMTPDLLGSAETSSLHGIGDRVLFSTLDLRGHNEEGAKATGGKGDVASGETRAGGQRVKLRSSERVTATEPWPWTLACGGTSEATVLSNSCW